MTTTYSSIQNNLNRLTTSMAKINERISSGMQMSSIADEPVNLVSALRYRTTIAELGKFSSNITHGSSVINASESALTQMKDLALQAKTLAIKASDPALSSDNLTAIAQQVKQMLRQAVELGNTQINGQFIFGGRRTTGYTAAEPAPFILGKGDGYWVNGAAMPPLTDDISGSAIATSASLQGPPVANIAAGDLLINGTDIGAVALATGGDVSGINMVGANNLKTAINAKTTVYADKAATAATAASAFTFSLNNTAISVNVSAGANANAVANAAITAINAQTAATGVAAVLGNGSNGGPVDSVVFQNSQSGDNSTISVSNFTTLTGDAKLGFTDFSQKIVTAALTTQTAGSAATLAATGGEAVAFSLNGANISYTLTAGTIAQTVQQTVAAINQASQTTGVTAQLGNGNNGGAVNSVVLTNTMAGDEAAITLANLGTGPPNEQTLTGLSNGTSMAGAGHNNGQIYLGMAASIAITTSGAAAVPPNDDILNRIGFGGGIGNYDAVGDGRLVYGYPLTSGDLKVNGIDVPATASDGHSDIYAAASAAAKAAAINSITAQTGITANITAAHVAANGAVHAGTETGRLTGVVTGNLISAADLAINGITLTGDIAASTGAVNGLYMDKAANAKSQINAISATTGVKARLTTLVAGSAATQSSAQAVSFALNGVPITLTTGGVSAAATAGDMVKAINAASARTGVAAMVGNGSNGGAANSIVLRNVVRGNENDIKVANLSSAATALSGLTNGTTALDSTHNTGEISFESDAAFILTSPLTSPPSDAVLQELGLSSANNNGRINYGSTPKYMSSGDLRINGIDIFAVPTAISGKDTTNALLDAINAQTAGTGVKGTRDANGGLRLTAVDGRNIHIQTSANGENISKLNGAAGGLDRVYFGNLQLKSDRKFILNTVAKSVNPMEPGLAAIGMAGGSTVTGESGDVAGDGRIAVFAIHEQTGTVRYTGDRDNGLNIKIGKTSTMKVADNGQTGVADTTIFTTLQDFEDALGDKNFTSVTGIHDATDTSQLLNSKTTGLEPDSQLPGDNLFSDGNFTVTVTDHDYYPPRTTAIPIGVNTAVDTLDSVTGRIDGIPHISAGWNSAGQLEIKSDEPKRYTISLGNDSSNFLAATGVSREFMQQQGISKAMDNLDTLMGKLTEQVSTFGARANRIEIQTQIYSDMTVSTKGNLSEVQDTDMIQAVMDLKAKQTAYQAALVAAAKIMKLSLVDYL